MIRWKKRPPLHKKKQKGKGTPPPAKGVKHSCPGGKKVFGTFRKSKPVEQEERGKKA